MRKAPARVLQVMAPTPPIRVGAQPRAGRTRWHMAYRLFLRLLAGLCFVQGAAQWLGVLTEPDGSGLGAGAPLHVTAVFFFCILDFVAGVGLWLTARWGVAIWAATILGHIAVTVTGAAVLDAPALFLAGDAGLVAVYVALVLVTARDRRG